jgi:hypothetical protein
MKPKWEKFNGRPFSQRARNEVRVTLGRKGQIVFNGCAFTALGRPAAVELLMDRSRGMIGIKPTETRRANAFPVGSMGGKYKIIRAAAFLQHHRIQRSGTLLFQDVQIEPGNIMALDLKTAVTVTRGAR